MVKIKVLLKCDYCDGKAYLPFKEAVDYSGRKYMQYLPCPRCHGSGLQSKWITLAEYKQLLEQETCPHKHVSRIGSRHITENGLTDDIREICDDCGKVLD